MNPNARIRRFQRLRQLDVRKRDLAARELARLAGLIQSLEKRLQQAEAERRAELESSQTWRPEERILENAWLDHSRYRSQLWSQELATIQEQWKAAREVWQQLNSKIEAWDRLITQLTQRLAHLAQHLELKQADEWATQRPHSANPKE